MNKINNILDGGKKKTKQNKNKRKRKTQKKKELKKLNCSGNTSKNDFTCYSDKSLDKIKKIWNLKHPDDKINENDTKKIWENLKNKLNNVCNSEACWLRQKFMEGNVDKEMLNYTFSPLSPPEWKKNPNTWLSSTDIIAVMSQYEKKYPFFEFLGPSPIDFDKTKLFGECVWEEICRFNVEDMLKKSKKKIGMIFNTDPHTKSGEHWIALFLDLERNFLFYFDSVAQRTPSPIMRLIERIIGQLNNLNKQVKIIKNNVPHQKKNTECGVYCLYFITELLKNKDPEFFLNDRIPDNEMEKFRKYFFNQ
tara:strand:+ start:1546 stop:2466 length:921 start_codon:yes stop_codon:yes gene_type:complete